MNLPDQPTNPIPPHVDPEIAAVFSEPHTFPLSDLEGGTIQTLRTIKLRKIISGGQTGADRGGLDAASAMGFQLGGHCPEGRRAEDGPIPAKYPLLVLTTKNYEHRTRRNVADADATLIFNAESRMSSGSNLTRKTAIDLGKPWAVIYGAPVPVLSFRLENGTAAPVDGAKESPAIDSAAARVALFLIQHNPTVLNIAGNRESVAPGMQAFVASVLLRAHSLAIFRTEQSLHDLANPAEKKSPPREEQSQLRLL